MTIWDDYLRIVSEVMSKYVDGDEGRDPDTLTAFDRFDGKIDTDIIAFCEATLSEIGGNPATFDDVKAMADRRVDQQTFRDYMDSPIVAPWWWVAIRR